MENFRLNSRVASAEREYLIQTFNDPTQRRVRSSVFSNGLLLDTVEEEFVASLPEPELLELVKNTHKERKEEIEHLLQKFTEAMQSSEIDHITSLGQAILHKRMYPEAEALFNRAVSLNPEAHESFNHLGMVFMAQGKPQEAVEPFNRCVSLQPKFADYHNNLGEAYLAIGSCKRAMIEFDEAINLNLYYGDAYFNKALTYVLNAIRREDFKLFSEHAAKTLEMLERAVIICPEYQDQTFGEGKALFEQGDLESAFHKLLYVREQRKERRNREFSDVYLRFLLSADRIDDRVLTRRIKQLKDALSKNPHYPDLHYELAVAYTLMGRFIHSKAIQEYQEALKINPQFERAKKSLKLAENEFRGFDALVKVITKG
jgi:tetratricopeptide (TPR) repeat protein